MVTAEERSIFKSFCETLPTFAGRQLVCQPGADPPDLVGTDAERLRVGIELGEWLNPQQMAESIARERQEDSFLNCVRSEEVEPPANIRFVWMEKAGHAALAAADCAQFQNEIYKCIADIDARWNANEEWHEPQGFMLSEVHGYPCLARYLSRLHFASRERFPVIKGVGWIEFPAAGGAYSPQNTVAALLKLIDKKTGMYGELHKKENLAELYLVAYYDRALIHNPPYVAPNFGWNDVAAIAAAEIAKNPGAFQKVFLFNALPQDRSLAVLWP
jgi:hypothetical protein